jgi:propanediol dehydratase small subunit
MTAGGGEAAVTTSEGEAAVPTRALSGRPVEQITVEAAVRGELSGADVRIHPDTLRRQADVAQRHGNPELAENLRRAAELAILPDAEVLAIYEALRPRRAAGAELESIAVRLESGGATRCAALVREAAEIYARRHLLKGPS